jgi:hypothetical protein
MHAKIGSLRTRIAEDDRPAFDLCRPAAKGPYSATTGADGTALHSAHDPS